jgi:hypothetical protein
MWIFIHTRNGNAKSEEKNVSLHSVQNAKQQNGGSVIAGLVAAADAAAALSSTYAQPC